MGFFVLVSLVVLLFCLRSIARWLWECLSCSICVARGLADGWYDSIQTDRNSKNDQ